MVHPAHRGACPERLCLAHPASNFLTIHLKRSLALLLCVAVGNSTAAAQEYDYFRNACFPGKLRDDVGLDKVEQAPETAGQPGRRVVVWWPKRGVDMVDMPVGVPLRTWTIRTGGEEPLVALFVKPGDVVGKDQVLGHTELDMAKLNVATARANLEATGTLEQMFWQYQALVVTREEMEEAMHKRTAPKSRLQFAQAMGKWAKGQYQAQQDIKKVQKINLEHCQKEYESRFIHSPVDGVVTEVKVALGQAVGMGAPIFTVSTDSNLSAPLAVPSAAAATAVQAGKLSEQAK